jgi:hypothetical protein
MATERKHQEERSALDKIERAINLPFRIIRIIGKLIVVLVVLVGIGIGIHLLAPSVFGGDSSSSGSVSHPDVPQPTGPAVGSSDHAELGTPSPEALAVARQLMYLQIAEQACQLDQFSYISNVAKVGAYCASEENVVDQQRCDVGQTCQAGVSKDQLKQNTHVEHYGGFDYGRAPGQVWIARVSSKASSSTGQPDYWLKGKTLDGTELTLAGPAGSNFVVDSDDQVIYWIERGAEPPCITNTCIVVPTELEHQGTGDYVTEYGNYWNCVPVSPNADQPVC